MTSNAQLVVIIVNYNSCELLRGCLASISASDEDIGYEVHVVDNQSSDDSCEMVRREFPWFRLVVADANLGFARANNLVLRSTDSDFVLLLNPDTVISGGVFSKCVRFLQDHSDVGMMTCKLVTGDGTLDLACRRSFPSVFDGLCRATGLSSAFPRSRVLARYNLTYLDEHQAAEVDAINGAFMMVRREAIRQVGILDEDYFMYGEDLDWSFRFKKAGWKVAYVPECTVLHFKGGTSDKVSDRMIREFFRSMRLFVIKCYGPEQPRMSTWVTLLGVRLWMQLTIARNGLRVNKRVRP
jgi:GT2 family glycosyltransferase